MASDDLNTWKTAQDFDVPDGRIVAEIETNAEYSDLELIDGHSHLTIKFDPSQPPPKRWTAKITPGLTNVELEITRFSGDPCCTNADAYPGVARWDYTTYGNNNNHVIGVKCADGWCEIGRKVHYQNQHSSPGKPQRIVKGYFDEQRLAVPEGFVGRLKPWKTATTIFPTPELATYTDTAQFRNKWLHVASIKSPDVYDKLKIKKHATIESELLLTYFSGTKTWWALMRTTDEENANAIQESLFKVKRVMHDDPIPAVVRWGWDDKDESVWVRCANGCCQMEEYDSLFNPTISETDNAEQRCTAGKPCYRASRNAAAQRTN